MRYQPSDREALLYRAELDANSVQACSVHRLQPARHNPPDKTLLFGELPPLICASEEKYVVTRRRVLAVPDPSGARLPLLCRF